MTRDATTIIDGLHTQLAEALRIIEMCERVFADPDKAVRPGYDRDAKHAVFDFMDAHREALREGGAR